MTKEGATLELIAAQLAEMLDLIGQMRSAAASGARKEAD
jgi:hypothetical protein